MNYDFYLFPSYKKEEKIKKSKILAPFTQNQHIFRDLLKSMHIW